MSKKSTFVQVRPGFAGCLGITFIVLKLCGVIEWSWWWVLSPFWIPLALFAVIALGIVIYAVATTD